MEFEKKSFLDFPGLQTYDSKIKDHIDKKIVQSDWEQNDTAAADYIKNRTHYIDVGTVTPYESYEIDCTEAPQSSLGTSYQNGIGYLSSEKFKINYIENKEYVITFDNTIYNCVATKTYLNQSEHATLIGNGALLTSFCKDNGMPFCFAYRAISDGVWYTAVSTQEVHTVTISYEDDIIVQLDEKYIPDTIQRVNNAVGRLGEGRESEIFNNYTSNTATGRCAHAEGHYTIASGKNQHVQGRFNIEDTNNTYAHIVGNGLSPMKRSNAHTLDWNGNGWYAGNLYVGGTSQADATRVATIADITNNFYPIGAIYLSTTETSPASLFGGTWEQIKDTFLLAAGDIYAAGTVGGSATHTLSVDELATHSHGVKTDINSSEFNIEWPPYAEYTYGWTQDAEKTIAPASQTTQVGKSQPFSIMPPYLAVYVWKRIA